MVNFPKKEILTDYTIHQIFQKEKIIRLINDDFSKKRKFDGYIMMGSLKFFFDGLHKHFLEAKFIKIIFLEIFNRLCNQIM